MKNKVLPGIDVLLRRERRRLRGRKLGLIANPTSVSADLQSSIDLLHAQDGAQLRALFAPEHGARGAVQDGLAIGASVDEATGVPVHSLYGASKRPSADALRELDLLIYDIQDVGCRYYTYPYTLSHAMEAAAAHDVEVMVLDRPNPLNGRTLEGPLLDPALSSFIGRYPLPVRHGLTIGELAQLMNTEFNIGCRLTVVPMAGWRRRHWFDQTGLHWVPPSPNIPTFETTRIYPGTCLFEGTNMSEGRGTTRPFEFIGAPWVDARALAAELNARELEGVRFRPVAFTPTFSKHADALCLGVQPHVVARAQLRAFEVGLHMIDACLKLHPDQFEFLSTSWEGRPPHFDLLTGRREIREQLLARVPVREIAHSWPRGLRAFRQRRAAYLLYE